MIKRFLLLFLIGFSICSKAQVFDAVVASDGSEDFETIQEAVNAMSANSDTRSIIFVKSGVYTEKIVVPSDKNNLSIIGENREEVIIEYGDYAGLNGMSSAESYTLMVEGKDFYMENVTLRNTAGNVGQALAIRTVGDRGVYKNCKFLGFQDTYYAHKARQYNYKCYIEGGTDFIYGDATAVFDNCQINCVSGGQYITAPADTKMITQFSTRKFLHGLLFRMCNITADQEVSNNSYYLGRPWQPNASSVYVKCTLGDHIKPEGWSIWNDNTHESSYFAEFENVDTNGNLIDVSNRADWSYQIEAVTYNNLYQLEFFFNSVNAEKWDPTLRTKNLLQPNDVEISNDLISWNRIEQAIGYVIYNEGVFYAAISNTSIAANGFLLENIEVKSVYQTGALSSKENKDLVGLEQYSINNHEIQFQIIENQLRTNEPVQLVVYRVNGQKVLENELAANHSLAKLNHGVYLFQLRDKKGNTNTFRINR